MTYKHIAMCGGREAGAHGINKTTFFAPAAARQRVGGKSREKSRSCLLFIKDAAEAPQVRHGPTRRIATAQAKKPDAHTPRGRNAKAYRANGDAVALLPKGFRKSIAAMAASQKGSRI